MCSPQVARRLHRVWHIITFSKPNNIKTTITTIDEKTTTISTAGHAHHGAC